MTPGRTLNVPAGKARVRRKRPGALRGLIAAVLKLGLLYKHGADVRKDEARVVELYQRAANGWVGS